MASGILVIILMVLMIVCVPLTIIARNAWRNRTLTFLFASIGIGSVIALTILTW